jgi:hypothetical protein
VSDPDAHLVIRGWLTVDACCAMPMPPDAGTRGQPAGDPVEPFLARVVHIIEGPRGSIVHLDVIGVLQDAIEELRHARLLPW